MTSPPPSAPSSRALMNARWALVAAAPAPIVLIGWWRGPLGSASIEAAIPAVLAVLALLAGGLLLRRRPPLALGLAALGLLALLAVAGPALVGSPALALLLAVVVLIALVQLRRATRPRRFSPSTALPPELERLYAFRGAGLTTTVLWIFSTLADTLHAGDALGLSALAVSGGVSFVLLARWVALMPFRRERWRVSLLALVAAGVPVFLAFEGLHPEALGDALASATVAGLVVLAGLDPEHRAGWWDLVLGHPARLLVATFAVLCLVGTVLLALPRASADGAGIALADASFVAVSAVCVTGLSTIDPGTALSPLGQGILLLLIQAGGLGIMTFSTAAMRLIGGRLSLRHEGAMAQLVSPEDRSRIFESTVRLIGFTFAVELLGAICLWIAFTGAGQDPVTAIWHAFFTAVSAFCNAGFALRPDNLMGFAGDPAVLHIVALLIILGGLSPIVVLAVPRWVRRRPIPVQARLALVTTAVLLLVGFFGYLALEWSDSLAPLSVGDRLHNAWFQSVTLRTAGFNSVDLTVTQPATLLMMMVLMLLGGSPGGTAGGMKTTTLAVIVLSILAIVRGRAEIVTGGRRISERTFFKATAVAAVFIVAALGGTVALLVTQDMPPRVVAFETVSALGTVGLTINGTPNLDEVGRGIIMASMFIGRVGPLTLLMFLSRERQRAEAWRHPETDIEVA